MAKWKNLVKSVLFSLGVAAMILTLTAFFKVNDIRIFRTVRGFYEEEENTLDAVYIGASNVYAYWQSPVAWGEYGQAVYPMAIPDMPVIAIKFMIEECRKTQPDALYIISLNSLKDTEFSEVQMHNMLDYLPFSETKVRMLNTMAAEMGCPEAEKLEYYFPFVRFHSGWDELDKSAFDRQLNGMKGAATYSTFLNQSSNLAASFRETLGTVNLTEDQDRLLQDLMDYCESEQVKTLFVVVPQIVEDESQIAQLNRACDVVREQGFDVLNLQDDMETIGLNAAVDFYNEKHTNVHGALKYTRFLAEFLRDHCGIADKRGDPAYSSWDSAYERYVEEIIWSTMEFERSAQQRDVRLDVPGNLTGSAYGSSAILSWEAEPHAQGYQIYKRSDYSEWELIAELEAEALSYTDEGLETDVVYTYTVVPVSYEGDAVRYGDFDPWGVEVTGAVEAPELVSLQEAGGSITVAWNPTQGAEGYYVDRMIVGQSWIRIADVTDGCTYTDLYAQEDVPYLYTVVPYRADGSVGSWNPQGLLRMADLAAPSVTAAAEGDQWVLSWSGVKGATGYYVYEQCEDGSWEQIGTLEAGETLTFRQDCREQREATFKVAAVLEHGQTVYEYPSDSVKVIGGNG